MSETQNTGASTNPTGRDELVERVARAIDPHAFIVVDAGVTPNSNTKARLEKARTNARAALTTIEASRNDGAAINAMSDVREALDWRQVQIETRRHAGLFVDRCDIEAVLKGIAALESLSGGGK